MIAEKCDLNSDTDTVYRHITMMCDRCFQNLLRSITLKKYQYHSVEKCPVTSATLALKMLLKGVVCETWPPVELQTSRGWHIID